MSAYLEFCALYPPLIDAAPAEDLNMVVVIPSFNEGALPLTLRSLWECLPTGKSVEVIVVINCSELADEKTKKINRLLFTEAKTYAAHRFRKGFRIHAILKDDLPAKNAGVGLARKIGMDEAVLRFEKAGQEDGVIICFDADTLCAPNYLQAIEHYFETHPKCPAANIQYAHPLSGDDHEDDIYRAIYEYELHLRYFHNAKKWAGFPYAFETIGSAMAVRSSAYQAEGGMNKRKAGEDFYFLNKFTAHSHFGEIKNTTVYPSPRVSDRVPFGTGKAVSDLIDQEGPLLSYHPKTFDDLKGLFTAIDVLFDKINSSSELPLGLSDDWSSLIEVADELAAFLKTIQFEQKIAEIKKHTNSFEAFEKRFFQFFNAFQIMKYAHFVRDRFYEPMEVTKCAKWLAGKLNINPGQFDDDLLIAFRDFDRK